MLAPPSPRPTTGGAAPKQRGRPRGIGNQAKLRKAIASHTPDILDALTAKAKDEDVAARVLKFDWVLPALKPHDEPVRLLLGDVALAPLGALCWPL